MEDGSNMQAGDVIGHKAGLLPVVSMASTEAEFMEATVMGITSKLNIVSIFTKQLGPILFCRHYSYLMGQVPPQYSSHYKDIHMMTNPLRLSEMSEMKDIDSIPKEKDCRS